MASSSKEALLPFYRLSRPCGTQGVLLGTRCWIPVALYALNLMNVAA
jgi:hypothetical protein